MRWRQFLFLLAGLLWAAPLYGETMGAGPSTSLLSSLNIPGPVDFCGEPVPIRVQEVRERFEKELLLALWDRPQVILWLKRSRRYLPAIEGLLKKHGMPEDLKYVAVAESALRPHAGSRRGAIGFWQFMKTTGQRYGLSIDARIDERRNLFASTEAAIRYFKELHQTFGSWTLVAAAFNMGEDGLMAEILEQGTSFYYDLYLPLETQRFVFRILSVKQVFLDPGKYGFQLRNEDYYPPLSFDSIQLDSGQETPIRIIAEAAKTSFKVIKDLNPEIRGYHLAAGNHRILVPKGAAAGFHDRYLALLKTFLSSQEERIYIVKEGDNLSSIAERFGIPLGAVIIWNRLKVNQPIHPGDRLLISRKKGAEGDKRSDEKEDERPDAGLSGMER